METEHWALLVSVVALVISVCVPAWQWRVGSDQEARSKRALLLQRILDAKSTTLISLHEAMYLLQRHGGEMEASQRENMEALLPRMRSEYEEMEKLHEAWSDYEDGESLSSIEKELSTINVIAAEATETAKLIENGRRSYEDA